jgi:hypothetical protein
VPPSPSALAYDKPLCASLDGFTLHAATRAGAHHAAAREALLRYVLRPPIAQERVALQQDGLVRLSLKRPFADGTVAVDMAPLSLLCRLAASVPPPRFHTVTYAGGLASASRPRWRASASERALRSHKSLRKPTMNQLRSTSAVAIGRSTNRAELLRRTFALDVLECPSCKGRMKLVAMVTEPRNIVRFLSSLGEPTDVPARSPSVDAATAVLARAPSCAARRSATPRSLPQQHHGPDQRPEGDVYTRHADAPLSALGNARRPLFQPMNEAPRRSRVHHFGRPRHTSSRCDPASSSYALPATPVMTSASVTACGPWVKIHPHATTSMFANDGRVSAI